VTDLTADIFVKSNISFVLNILRLAMLFL